LEEAWGETPFVNANPGDYARELAHREEVAMRFLDDHFAERGGSAVPLRDRPDSMFADPDVAASLQNPSAESRERARGPIEAAQEQPRRQRGGIRGAMDRLRQPSAQEVAGRVADHIREHGLPTITPEQADAIHKEEEDELWKRRERERRAGLR
jgi:hypothetical protein